LRYFFSILSFIFIAGFCSAQDTLNFKNNSDVHGLLRCEKSGGLVVHAYGWGLNYRTGRHITGYKKRMLELEFVGMKHPKEIKTYNPGYEGSKSFIFGKENVLFILRAGIGIQKVLNEKPYWGGVQVRYFMYGGASIGLLKPVYLLILKPTSDPKLAAVVEEKYDPNVHSISDIYGRASFLKGIGETKLHPGIYGKFGFNFEYGVREESMKVIEAGITVDAYPKPVPMMAFTPDKSIFLSLYISFQIGKRFNKF